MDRYVSSFIEKDLQKKMVFVAGARQVGKTTLAKNLLPNATYYNWDIEDSRQSLLKRELLAFMELCLRWDFCF